MKQTIDTHPPVNQDADLPPERIKAMEIFNEVRELLLTKYLELLGTDEHPSNSNLIGAIKDNLCDDYNEDLTSVIKQWEDIIKRYTKEPEYQNTRGALLEVLNDFSPEE